MEEEKTELKEKQETFNKENANSIDWIDKLKLEVLKLKETITKETLTAFNIYQIKKREFGIGVQVRNVFNYETKDAFNWAKEHSLCLKLDDKAFKNLIKSTDFDFVEKTNELKVTFPSVITIKEQIKEAEEDNVIAMHRQDNK